jgi:uncharacterized protein Veg
MKKKIDNKKGKEITEKDKTGKNKEVYKEDGNLINFA